MRTVPRPAGVRWVVSTLLLLALGGGLGSLGGLGRADLALVDALRFFDVAAPREDIVAIAIDDTSLAALGPLPWNERVYERLLDTLHEGQPRVIGIITPWNRRYLTQGSDERVLAQAVARTGNVVLPVVMAGSRGGVPVAVPPVPQLKQAAEAQGHVHTVLDADGVARSVWLRAGPREEAWDHLALAVYKVGRGEAPAGSSDAVHGNRWQEPPDDATRDWRAEGRLIVPFPRTRVKHYSFVDVVAGLVPPEAIRNRYVLVGATASGVGNAFTTPDRMRGTLMPETDLTAAVLQALLEQRHVHPASPRANALANAAPALVAGFALALLPMGAALAVLAAAAAALLAGTAALPLLAQLQIYPAAGLIALLLAYPLWMGLRLFAAVRSLSAEVDDMQHSIFPPAQAAPAGSDMIERHIGRLHDAIDQLRTTQRLVNDSLDSVPDVTFITDAQGRVQIANAAAERYLRGVGVNAVIGVELRDLGLQILPPMLFERVAAHFKARPPTSTSIELAGSDGHDYLLRIIPRHAVDGAGAAGWIVSLVDIHTVREAQKQRDDALRFISHDMRSPQSSILSLIELHSLGAEEVQDVDELLRRIGRYARSALDLSEDFIQLARADAGHVSLAPHDLHGLLSEAADLVWARAREKGIRIEWPETDDEAICRVDRSLMTRAFMNLLDNAVKFSPDGTTIHCEITEAGRDGSHFQVSVRDQGPGLPVSDVELLFEKFRRAGTHEGQPRVEGAGLGLAFVKSVVQAHGGSLSALNCTEQGAEFRICLPRDGKRADSATDH